MGSGGEYLNGGVCWKTWRDEITITLLWKFTIWMEPTFSLMEVSWKIQQFHTQNVVCPTTWNLVNLVTCGFHSFIFNCFINSFIFFLFKENCNVLCFFGNNNILKLQHQHFYRQDILLRYTESIDFVLGDANWHKTEKLKMFFHENKFLV